MSTVHLEMEHQSQLLRGIIAAFVVLILASATTLAQQAVRFESPGDYAEVPHSSSLTIQEFSIEFWLRVYALGDPDAATGEQTILDKRGPGTGFNIRLAGTEFPLPVFGFVEPGGVDTYPSAVQRNEWFHIAVTQDADSLRIYMDGSPLGVSANVYAWNTNSPMRIGEFLGYPNAYLGLRGELDELRIWNYARTASEIRAAQHVKLTGNEAGLAGYWDFDLRENAFVRDLSPNDNDARLLGQARLVPSDAPVGFVPPEAARGLRALGHETGIEVRWAPVPGAGAYWLYRGEETDFEAEETTRIATIQGTDSVFSDAGVSLEATYFYKLRTVVEGHAGRASGPAAGRRLSLSEGYATGVYYYPWYGPAEGGHRWRDQNLRDRLVPKQPPVLGFYSSRNPDVIRQHLEWMASYGIDFIVSSWWGRGTWEDVTLRDYILPEIAKTSIRFSVYYESPQLGFDPGGFTIDQNKRARLREDYRYLADTYFAHPNHLQIDGAPVVFVYLSRLYSGDFDQAFEDVRSDVAAKGYSLYLVGDEVGWGPTSADHMQFLDAVSPYIVLDRRENPGHLADTDYFAELSMQAVEWKSVAESQGKAFVPNVFPGFNSRSGGPSPVSPRRIRPGAASTSMLVEMIRMFRPFVDPDRRLIMITSWNEWHEDTQIEPVVEAQPTTVDESNTGDRYSAGYSYEGYGLKPLLVVADLLAPELAVGIEDRDPDRPTTEWLQFSYPNPATGHVSFRFELSRATQAELSVFDVTGRLVTTLMSDRVGPGRVVKRWQTSTVAPGLYLCRLVTDGSVTVRPITVLN